MPATIKCPGCGTLIGEVVVSHEIELLHVGGGIWRELRGYCAQCGEAFHWSVKDKQIQTMIKNQGVLVDVKYKISNPDLN